MFVLARKALLTKKVLVGEFDTELSRESVAGVQVIAHGWFTLHFCVRVKTVLRGFDVQLYGRPLPCIKF